MLQTKTVPCYINYPAALFLFGTFFYSGGADEAAEVKSLK